MKKLILLLTTFLSLFTAPATFAGETAEEDQLISFRDDFKIADLDESDKDALYEKLDKVKKDSKNYRDTVNYSQITEFEEDQDYINFLMETNNGAKVIYLGYETSEFCQAFVPKINQLAKEYDLDIHYYNVLRFEGGQSYDLVKELYNVETVPYAFIVKDNEVVDSINADSSMSEIEEFMKKASEEK